MDQEIRDYGLNIAKRKLEIDKKIKEFENKISHKIEFSNEVIPELVQKVENSIDKFEAIFGRLEKIINSKSVFKQIEIDIWIRDLDLSFSIQASMEKNNKFLIADRPLKKYEPNSLRIITSLGPIQFRVPPNTIKNIKRIDEEIAQYYVITEKSFHDGVNYIGISFPIFDNFFLQKGKKTYILCPDKNIKERAETLAKEEIFGVSRDDLINSGISSNEADNMIKEFSYFNVREGFKANGRILELNDFVEFLVFKNGVLKIDNIEIRKEKEKDIFTVYEKDKYIAKANLERWEKYLLRKKFEEAEPGENTEFGVYFFDPSTGFDPERLTSSFIVWIGGGKGIVVDPLANLSQYLRMRRIKPEDMEYILLTHTHADHDDGVLEMILKGRFVRILTTRIVMDSFLKKVKAITNWSDDQINNVVNFIEVKIGEPMILSSNVSLKLEYGFHSVPTCGFVIEYKDEQSGISKSISYSGDTLYNPDLYNKLVKKGIMTSDRAETLKGFVWESDLIIHDCGGGGIHTDPLILKQKPAKIKQKIVGLHSSRISTDIGIRQAGKGDEITLVEVDMAGKMQRMIKDLNDVILLQPLTAKQKIEILNLSNKENYNAGENIIVEGEKGDKFYIIQSGEVEVLKHGKRLAYLGKGDYFGEIALMSPDHKRTATVKAISDITVLCLNQNHFDMYKKLIYDTYKSIVDNRSILSRISFFSSLPAKEIAILSILFKEKKYSKGEYVVKQGEMGDCFYVVRKGRLRVAVNTPDGKEKVINELGDGEPFGEIALIEDSPRTADVIVVSDIAFVIQINRATFDQMAMEYPGITVGLNQIKEEREEITRRSI